MSSADSADEAVASLRDLHDEIDAAAKALAKTHARRMQCRRGCSACCLDDLTVTQVEAEAGIATDPRLWTAERVKQAIDELADAATLQGALAGDIDLSGFEIVSGANSVLAYSGGQVELDGQPVIPASVTTPAFGDLITSLK